MEDFKTWLEMQLEDRGWSIRELARRGDISHAQIAGYLAGDRGIGITTILGIARALNETPEKLLEMAGMLDVLPASFEDKTLSEIYQIVKRLPAEERQEILDYVSYRRHRRRES